jgi:uncharacterized membrane protein YtjA (UPF0391 family)
MLKWAVIFLVLALVLALLGFTQIAAGFAAIARILFYLFLVIVVILFILGLIGKNKLT